LVFTWKSLGDWIALSIFTLAILAVLAGLAGCATREKLQVADRAEQIVLTEKVSNVSHSLNGTRWEYIALPGAYEAERKDSQGVYFYGPGRPIVEISGLYKDEPRLKVGGIYLPDDTSKPAEIVFAFEMQAHTTSDLNQYITQRAVATTSMPAMQPGVGTGANVVGGAIAGALIDAMLVAGEGEITRITVKDAALSAKLRGARRTKDKAEASVQSKSPLQ
jgi:hypothetical protein